MLRTNQLSGADEVYLERIDNGVFVRLATVNRDLAAGDTLLFRITGSKLEAWLLHAGVLEPDGDRDRLDLRGRRLHGDRPARHDRPAGRLRRAHAPLIAIARE